MQRTNEVKMTGAFPIDNKMNSFDYNQSAQFDFSEYETKPYMMPYHKASAVFGTVVLALAYCALFIIGLSA